MEKPPLICPFCKSELEPGASACEVCGRSLSDAVGAPVSEEEKPASNIFLELPTLLPDALKPDDTSPARKDGLAQPAFGGYPSEGGPATPRQIFILVGAVVVLACLLVAGGTLVVQFVMNRLNEQSAAASQTAQVFDREATRTAFVVEQTLEWEAFAARTTQEAQATDFAFDSQSMLAEVPSWTVILDEQFDDELGGWYLDKGEDDLSFYDYYLQDGVYVIDMTAKSGMSQWLWPDVAEISLESFYFAADMRMSGPDTMDGGLIFHLGGSEDNDFYLLDVVRSGEVGVFLHDSSGWTMISDYVFTGLVSADEANRIEILAQPSADGLSREFHFFVNGSWLSSLEDDTYSGGWVGVQVGLSEEDDRGVWEFDNIVLRIP